MLDTSSREDFERRARKLAPLTDDEVDQLRLLVEGVSVAAHRMRQLAPPFGGEVDTKQFSLTVDGDR